VGVGIYVLGVFWGLLKIDAPPRERIGIALLWPVGPLAFVATVTLLLMALPVAFPKVGIPFWAAAGVLAWLVIR
jgi:hypothetical protein